MINIVNATSFQKNYDTLGLLIEAPQYQVIPLNSNFSFNFHVYNSSSGKYINSSECSSYLYHFETGQHILTTNNISLKNNREYEYKINNTLFTQEGTYYHSIYCQSNTKGGFLGFSFEVGNTLRKATTSDAIINAILLIIFVIFFIVSLCFAFWLEGDNKFTIGDQGEPLVEININKYLKLFLYLLSYLFFWMLTWSAWQIAYKFLLSTTLTEILRIIFIIETIFWFPLIFIIVTIGFIKHIADINIEKTTKRGLFPRK